MRYVSAAVALVVLGAWAGPCACEKHDATTTAAAGPAGTPPAPACDAAHAMTVHFYDVGQALAVLVDLPDGRHVLVDAGDAPRRCGEDCERAHDHLVASLTRDLRGAPVDMMWITHPHSDHVGGAPGVLASLHAAGGGVRVYVDNGRDAAKTDVRRAREAAQASGAVVRVVDPDHRASPLPSSARARITPILPAAWPRSCAEDENECSIALRIDACGASVLLTGDAEHEEEAMLDMGGPVTLLQVAHHGSDTSTSPATLAKLRPRYAVVSAGRPDEGRNREYCHPRAQVVERLSRALGGGNGAALTAFDGARARCDRAGGGDWLSVPSSDRLWATERDGDVVLTTAGDGTFRRVAPGAP